MSRDEELREALETDAMDERGPRDTCAAICDILGITREVVADVKTLQGGYEDAWSELGSESTRPRMEAFIKRTNAISDALATLLEVAGR